MTERRKNYNKKEQDLIVQFEKSDSDFEIQRFKIEKFLRFFTEITKEDYTKNLEYKNYREREFYYCQISNYENLIIKGLLEIYEECYKKHHSARTFSK